MSRKNTLKQALLDHLALTGLELAPAQVWGGVRMVPLLRPAATGELRLARRRYKEDTAVVAVGGPLDNPKTWYGSYVPHALVATWSEDGPPEAAFGTQLKRPSHGGEKDGKVYGCEWETTRVLHRMTRREDRRRLRFLPMHLGMEGYLTLHFGGPDVAWSEYSRTAKRFGLGWRSETSMMGGGIPGLADALRVFEIHDDQVGVLVFVADALASAFVVPHPSDYRSLHASLIQDFYGELLFYYGLYATENELGPDPIQADRVASIADLRRELRRMRDDWAGRHVQMSHGLLGRPVVSQPVYRLGPFQLQRFMTELDPKAENHMGEAIVREDGTLEYLKTYRLSAAQCRRAYLLSRLAECQWSLDSCAELLKTSRDGLVRRLDNAGFGYLLADHVLAAARRRKR